MEGVLQTLFLGLPVFFGSLWCCAADAGYRGGAVFIDYTGE